MLNWLGHTFEGAISVQDDFSSHAKSNRPAYNRVRRVLPVVFTVLVIVAIFLAAHWSATHHHEFFDGGWGLNFYGFWFTTAGAIISIVAYWIALWQLAEARESARRAASAATLAASAVKDATARLSNFTGFVGLTDLCFISNSVCSHLTNKKFDQAQDRLGDLFRIFRGVRSDSMVDALLTPEGWDKLEADLSSVQKILVNQITAPKKVTQTILVNHVQMMNSAGALINDLKNRHARKLGEAHAARQ